MNKARTRIKYSPIVKNRIRRMGFTKFLYETYRQQLVRNIFKMERFHYGLLPDTGNLEEGC